VRGERLERQRVDRVVTVERPGGASPWWNVYGWRVCGLLSTPVMSNPARTYDGGATAPQSPTTAVASPSARQYAVVAVTLRRSPRGGLALAPAPVAQHRPVRIVGHGRDAAKRSHHSAWTTPFAGAADRAPGHGSTSGIAPLPRGTAAGGGTISASAGSATVIAAVVGSDRDADR
jgi:hypothetical protein